MGDRWRSFGCTDCKEGKGGLIQIMILGNIHEKISTGLFYIMFVILIGFLLLELLTPWNFYINYSWVPVLAICMGVIGLIIKCDGLQRELSRLREVSQK
jgi:hypothetical protein